MNGYDEPLLSARLLDRIDKLREETARVVLACELAELHADLYLEELARWRARREIERAEIVVGRDEVVVRGG